MLHQEGNGLGLHPLPGRTAISPHCRQGNRVAIYHQKTGRGILPD
jgi:hypothetical protein